MDVPLSLSCLTICISLVCIFSNVANGSALSGTTSDYEKDHMSTKAKRGIRSFLNNYTIFQPKVYEQSNSEVLNTTKFKGGHYGEITFKIPTLPENFDAVFLKLDPMLWSTGFVINIGKGQRYYASPAELKAGHCHYTGYVIGMSRSRASFSTCNGLSGFVKLDKERTINIEPADEIISPENVLNRDHVIYNRSDQRPAIIQCGEHKISRDDFKFNKKPTKDPKISTRERRNHIILLANRASVIVEPQFSDKSTKYIEVYMIFDYREFQKLGSIAEVRNKALELVNVINQYFRQLNFYVVLIELECWSTENMIELDEHNLHSTLVRFQTYASVHIKRKRDITVLLLNSHHKEVGDGDGKAGVAFTGTVCSYVNAYVVVQERLIVKHQTGLVIAHEMGHVMGLTHDQPICNCTGKDCLMSTSFGPDSVITEWSDCSKLSMNAILHESPLACLDDLPTPDKGLNSCGNGIKEAGEDCDCGLDEECGTQNCCIAKQCRLARSATCSTGKCCDIKTCKFKARGVECRAARTCCDLPEYCTGDGEDCPEDVHVYDGHPCKAYEEESICFRGLCNTYNGHCKYLWGPKSKKSVNHCYTRFNVMADYYGHCDVDVVNRTYTPCQKNNVYCGLLHCRFGSPAIDEAKELSHNHEDGDGQCQVTVYASTPNLGLVRDGVQCSTNSICLNRECVYMRLIPGCHCRAGGFCDNRGQCHYKGRPLKKCLDVNTYSKPLAEGHARAGNPTWRLLPWFSVEFCIYLFILVDFYGSGGFICKGFPLMSICCTRYMLIYIFPAPFCT